jgi:tRNA(Arg) A34 adenosine deaminase TadA
MDHPAHPAWTRLHPAWKRCLGLAWEAYCAGTIPVGAVVADSNNRIVAEGLNHVYGAQRAAGTLMGTVLAHAEVNALIHLEPGHYPEHTLYSSLEPCLLCVGAAAMVTIGTVRFAGTDPYGGAAHIIGHARNEHLDRFRFTIEGPLDGSFGILGAALVVAHYLQRAGGTERGSGRHVVQAYRREAPEMLLAAERIRGQEQSAEACSTSLVEALPALWDAIDRS